MNKQPGSIWFARPKKSGWVGGRYRREGGVRDARTTDPWRKFQGCSV